MPTVITTLSVLDLNTIVARNQVIEAEARAEAAQNNSDQAANRRLQNHRSVVAPKGARVVAKTFSMRDLAREQFNREVNEYQDNLLGSPDKKGLSLYIDRAIVSFNLLATRVNSAGQMKSRDIQKLIELLKVNRWENMVSMMSNLDSMKIIDPLDIREAGQMDLRRGQDMLAEAQRLLRLHRGELQGVAQRCSNVLKALE